AVAIDAVTVTTILHAEDRKPVITIFEGLVPLTANPGLGAQLQVRLPLSPQAIELRHPEPGGQVKTRVTVEIVFIIQTKRQVVRPPALLANLNKQNRPLLRRQQRP